MKKKSRVFVAALVAAGFGSISGMASSANAAVVINEIDYDNVGTDLNEFIEIYNNGTTAVPIGGYVLGLINGSNDQFYAPVITITAGTTLAPGAYYVVGSPTVVGANQVFGAQDQVQNGSPDAVGLYSSLGAIAVAQPSTTNSAALVDGVVYEGPETGSYPGFTQSSVADSNTLNQSFGRSPNGTGDFALLESPTPGAANAAVVVPEPASLGLLGVAGLLLARRRRSA